MRRESLQQTNKQEVKISKAVVPRKGLIQLSTGETEGLDPFGGIYTLCYFNSLPTGKFCMFFCRLLIFLKSNF